MIVTCVALVAATVRMDELPAVIEVGLAVMLTVGNGVGGGLLEPPGMLLAHPVNNRISERQGTIAAARSERERNRGTGTFLVIGGFSLLCTGEERSSHELPRKLDVKFSRYISPLAPVLYPIGQCFSG